MSGATAPTQRGFTLVEMMVVVALLAILLAAAAPGMREFSAANRLATTKSAFTGALALARTEAAKRGSGVFLRASGAPAAGNEYAAGWQIVADDNGNGVIDATDTVVRTYDALPAGITLSGNATLLYRAAGFLGTTADQLFTVCRADGSGKGFRIAVTPSGVTDVAQITNCP
ncbi:MAG: GspH/FimT family protein [Burkholderiales bacterium]|nr:GspH/FimT family protein [Burkholderiales bacterium]